MDIQLGIMYARMLRDGVVYKNPKTGEFNQADPGAAMMGKIDSWIQRHSTKDNTEDPVAKAVREHMQKERAAGHNLPPLSSEPDAASN